MSVEMSLSGLDERVGLLLSGFDDLRRSLECGICLEVLRGPVRTKCGHVFCRLCMHRAVDAAMEVRAKQETAREGQFGARSDIEEGT